MSVLFHGSFGLNREYMSGLLAHALSDATAKDKELAKPFGYGAPSLPDIEVGFISVA